MFGPDQSAGGRRSTNLGGLGPGMVGRFSRGSLSGPGPGARDVEFDYIIRQSEQEYPAWWTRKRIMHVFYSLPEDSCWNAFICLMALSGIVWVAVALKHIAFKALDAVYNISYAIHVFGLTYSMLTRLEAYDLTFTKSLAFLVDMATFSHYTSKNEDFKLLCYYLRLHRPFSYLWALNDYNLKGSVLGTTLKFCYIFLVMRVSWALVWLNVDALEQTFFNSTALSGRRALEEVQKSRSMSTDDLSERNTLEFLSALYLVNKMFVPIGPSVPPANDIERLTCLCIMLSGCLVVTAFAVASLTLVISLYMRPEETFRARYRLIIEEMKQSNIPLSQRDKVETFYKMYWHKQRAVSTTQLLPTFPPTIPATIFTDIYFEATQKSRILCDLSYQFLSELAKKMETIHYIPGDAIIKRMSPKNSYIYITYGDVEMVTAEDDSTAILRMTRGTVLSACAVCAPAGLGRAHLEVRAATFCTAHVLSALNLWKAVIKHGRTDDETEIISGAYNDHLERVKIHYQAKVPEDAIHKSSILYFKRCLMALKEAKDAHGDLLLARTDIFLEIAKCYLMRNRADATLTDESDAICLRPTFPCILQPTSSLQMAWNVFVACLIVIVIFVHPYYLVFSKVVPIEFRFFDHLVSFVYILDLIVHLSTGANVEEGVPITFTQTSSQQMRSHWFVLDVLGTAPILEFIGTGRFAGINKILRLPKIFKVLKELEDRCVYRGHILRFCSYMLLLLLACYLIGALQQGFMCYQFKYCLVTNLTHSPYWDNKPLDEETVHKRVFFALYWAISMIIFTSHMETWGTENWNYVLYTLVVLELCIVLRIFMEAVYSATILVTTALREDYDACILKVKNFLIRNQVDPILRQRFISYLQLCWYTDKAYSMTNRRSIFYDLPSHVYQDIVAKQRSKYILSIPFMKYVSKEDLKTISSTARLFYTSPNEILLNTGDISNEIYIIKQGICEILSPDTGKSIGLLTVKCHFGVLVCLLRIPALFTIRAVTNVQVFSLSRKYLLHAIESPHIKDALEYLKTQPEYQRLLNRREPFITYKTPDPIPNREFFPLPRKHEEDAAFLHPFYRLGFLSVMRYIFPRFTIRPDGEYLIRYEWFRAICAFTAAMVFPSYLYLVLQWPWLRYFTLLLDMTAYFDIVQRMLIGYYNDMGILVSHPSSTAAYYMRGAFFVDLFACLPLEDLESTQVESGNRYTLTQMKQFLMMNRLMQIYRLPSAMLVLHGFIERRDILTVIKAIPMLMVLLNVVTCLMVLYSVSIYGFTDSKEWMIVPFNDEGGSWINLFSHHFRFNITETPWNLHLATYFWVVYETSTTGYNILKPSNVDLLRVLFLGMLVISMLITYFSVRIISIRANVNKALAEFQAHMKDMVIYMKRENLKPDLQKVVLEYYEYTWDKMGGVDYRQVFKLCDQITLRTDAILHIYGPTFTKCDVSLMRIVGRAVRSAYFLRDMTVIEANDVISEMYFVDYGGVDAREFTGDVYTVVHLPRGSIFGNMVGLPTVCCSTTFVATSKVHLLMINSSTFHHIINDFPSVKKLLKKFQSKNKNNDYIMGNVADTLNVAQQRTISSTPALVTKRKELTKLLYFNDKYIHIYLITISLLCIYADGYNAGFQDNRMPLIIFLYVLDACFFMKILMQYSLPLIVEAAAVRKALLPARHAYFHGEFRYDLLSCIPIELTCYLSHKYKWIIFSCLRLNRLFRVVTVSECLKRNNERITINLILSTALSAFIWFTLFVHITSCLWHFIAYVEDLHIPKSSWIYKDDGSSWCNNYYICSTYFVLTTFIQNGVGDIMPKKQTELVFVCALQIISTMIYMIYVGEFSNIIQYQSFRSFSFYSKYLELQEFMNNNKVSKNLVHIVNQYSLHLWREKRGLQAPHFLRKAPQALRLQIMSAAYLHHLSRHHVFEDCEPAFLRQLVGCLKLLTYNEDMYVVKSSEITDAMYLIHTGKIEEIADTKNKVPRIYPAGSYFGVLQGMIHDLPFSHSYRTLIRSQVLTLRLDDWYYLVKHFPASKDAIFWHMKYEDPNKDSSGGSPDTWPKPKPPKPPLVTELTDRGSPPTPTGDSEPPTKSSKFVVPEGPKRSPVNEEPLTALEPGLWPTTSRDFGTSTSSKEITQDEPAEDSTRTQRTTSRQRFSNSLQPPASTPLDDTVNKDISSNRDENDTYTPSEDFSEKERKGEELAASTPLTDTAKKDISPYRDKDVTYTPSEDFKEEDREGQELAASTPLTDTAKMYVSPDRNEGVTYNPSEYLSEKERKEEELAASTPLTDTAKMYVSPARNEGFTYNPSEYLSEKERKEEELASSTPLTDTAKKDILPYRDEDVTYTLSEDFSEKERKGEELAASTPLTDTAGNNIPPNRDEDLTYTPSEVFSKKDNLLILKDKSATNILVEETDKGKKIQYEQETEKDEIETVEQDILNEILSNASATASVITDANKEEETEKHMLTVDITEPKDNIAKTDADFDAALAPYSATDIIRTSRHIAIQQDRIVPPVSKKKKKEVHAKAVKKTKEKELLITDLDDDVPLPGVSKDINEEERRPSAEPKDDATSTAAAKRRFIRVRYEDDKRKSRANSADYHAYERQDRLEEMTAAERNLHMLDSDISLSHREYSEEIKKPAGSNTTLVSGSTSSTESLKTKKKKYKRLSE